MNAIELYFAYFSLYLYICQSINISGYFDTSHFRWTISNHHKKNFHAVQVEQILFDHYCVIHCELKEFWIAIIDGYVFGSHIRFVITLKLVIGRVCLMNIWRKVRDQPRSDFFIYYRSDISALK